MVAQYRGDAVRFPDGLLGGPRLRGCGREGRRFSVGGCGCGLVPISWCDFRFGPRARVVVLLMSWRLASGVLTDPWYSAV